MGVLLAGSEGYITDRQTGRQTDRQAYRQTDRYTYHIKYLPRLLYTFYGCLAGWQ
jgi:hypothetical protein